MSKPAPEKPKTSFTSILLFVLAFMVLLNPGLRNMVGSVAGLVLDPLIGFDEQYPTLTIFLAGTMMVLLTTLVRHFTTDWLEMARAQNYMRSFQKEFSKARKENNTYKMKILQEKQPEVMKRQQEMSAKQLKLMPLTLLVVMPFFTWMFLFLDRLDYPFYSAPWNLDVAIFGTTIFPHWILLYTCLSIPLGALAQKTMKFYSWRGRWQGMHPEVHE